MDAQQQRLQKKLEELLKETSRVAAELQGIEQGPGVPHYDQIELPAHELGKRLGRMIQSARAREVAASAVGEAACPKCGRKHVVATKTRDVHSMDGPLELLETAAYCDRCRRSFFPSARGVRIGLARIDAGLQAAGGGGQRRDALGETHEPGD